MAGSTENIVVDYDYEIETNTAVQSDMIPAVERAINDVLLAVLFSELCGGEDDLGRRTLLEGGATEVMSLRGIRKLQTTAVAALSPSPPDLVQTGDTCLNDDKIKAGSSCSVVSGRLSIYGNFSASEDASRAARTAVADTIQRGMENDELVSAHPSIVRLFFVPRNSSFPLGDTSEVRFVDVRADGGGGSFPLIIAASIASLAIFGIAVGWNKSLRGNEDEQEEVDDADGDGAHVLSAKRRSLVPEDDCAASWQMMNGAAVEEASVLSSVSDETYAPEAISAVYGITDAHGYRRHPLALHASEPAVVAALDFLALSNSAASNEENGDMGERLCNLGIASRREFNSEGIMTANSVLFSTPNKGGDDEHEDSNTCWDGRGKRVWRSMK